MGLTGCQSLFGKRSADARPVSGPDRGPATFPGASNPNVNKGDGEMGGLLAGYVIDDYNNHPDNTYIRWVCVDEPQDKQAPIDVAVSPQGYFTIRGLKRDRNYKLIARSKTGENKMIAGITYTRAPDVRVVIKMSEGLASAEIPEIPGSPALADTRPPATMPTVGDYKEAEQAAGKEVPASAKMPSWEAAPPDTNTGVKDGAAQSDLRMGGPPLKMDTMNSPPPPSFPDLPPTSSTLPPTSPAPPPTAVFPGGESPGWVPGIASQARNWPPVMNVPPTKQMPPPVLIRIERPLPIEAEAEAPPPQPAAPMETFVPPSPPPFPVPTLERARSQTVIPSCVLLGRKLVNFALYDLNNQPWEFRTHRRGKVVLIDFWGTQCLPCIESIPYLRKLHSDFSSSGLEVVGIAYDHSSTPQAQNQRIRQMSQKLQINYLQLQGAGGNCPVSQQFGITGIPTLVLVDENGWILWRHVGMLDAYRHQELELLIRQKLELQRQ